MIRKAGLGAVVVLLASASLAAALPHAQEPAEPAATPAKLLTGPELFVSSGCSHCHEIDGVGGHKGPELSGIGRRWKDDAIRDRIEHGALEMPAYVDVLSPPDVTRLGRISAHASRSGSKA